MSGGTALAVTLAAVAGIAGPVQAAIMGELGTRVGVSPALAFSGLLTTVLAAAILLAAQRSLAGMADVVREPVWLWTGGALSLLIIVAVTVAPPRVGTTATIGIIIAGNLIAAAAIDRYGFFGVAEIPLTWPRLLGIALLAVGAALSLHKG